MPLIDSQCKAAKPGAKPYTLKDGNSLFLRVAPTGVKTWQHRYQGKTRSLGAYPEVSLAAAREAMKTPLPTIEPVRQSNAGPSVDDDFETMAGHWIASNHNVWGHKHERDVSRSLKAHVFGFVLTNGKVFGKLPVASVHPTEINQVLMAQQKGGHFQLAKQLQGRISGVFGHAISLGVMPYDPAAGLRKIVNRAPPAMPRVAVLTLPEAQEVIRQFDLHGGFPVIKLAHRFLALTSVRTTEVLGATWDEFMHLDGGGEPYWTIPASRMKMKKPHYVALSRQAVEILNVFRSFRSKGGYVFRSPHGDAERISPSIIAMTLARRLGYKGQHVPHGWRSSFITIMRSTEEFRNDSALLNAILAHQKGDVQDIYDRALNMPRRQVLHQAWADMLLKNALSIDQIMNIPSMPSKQKAKLVGERPTLVPPLA